LKFLELELLTI